MTSPSYPAALDSLANPGPTTETDDAGFELDVVVARLQNCVMAIEGKLGIGTGGPPAAAAVLRRTATGSSGWGGVTAADIAPGAVHQQWTAGAIPTSGSNQVTTGSWYDLPGAQLAVSGLTVGSLLIVAYAQPFRHSATNGRNQVRVVRLDTGAAIGQAGGMIGGPAATPVLHAGVQYVVPNVTGFTLSVQGYMVDAGSSQTDANTGSLVAIELRP